MIIEKLELIFSDFLGLTGFQLILTLILIIMLITLLKKKGV